MGSSIRLCLLHHQFSWIVRCELSAMQLRSAVATCLTYGSGASLLTVLEVRLGPIVVENFRDLAVFRAEIDRLEGNSPSLVGLF